MVRIHLHVLISMNVIQIHASMEPGATMETICLPACALPAMKAPYAKRTKMTVPRILARIVVSVWTWLPSIDAVVHGVSLVRTVASTSHLAVRTHQSVRFTNSVSMQTVPSKRFVDTTNKICSVSSDLVFNRCVDEVDEAQTYALIMASQVQGNGVYGAETHIEYCISYLGSPCPLSLVQSVAHANQPARRAATGRRYMARITSVTAWPNQDEYSLFELVLFDRNNNYEIVKPFGPNGTCALLKKTDLRCVNYGQCLDVNRLGKKCSKLCT